MIECTDRLHQPETYVIGFTENCYSTTDGVHSPSPTDHVLGYTSPALDYAERSNKGANNVFLGKSQIIDKALHRSVGKINHGILDIMFEISERRKTPITGHSFRDNRSQSASELSDISIVSFKSTSSEPILQVQQLPPRSQNNVLPVIKGATVKQPVQPKTANKKKIKTKTKDKDKDKTETSTSPRFLGVVDSYVAFHKNAKANKDIDSLNNNNKQLSNKDCNDIKPAEESDNDKKKLTKWQKMTQKLVEVNKLVREGTLDVSTYKGRYHTPGFTETRRRLSYCQCSYDERTEKERMGNIMRKHISQAKTGPIDLGILKRQITRGRSKSFAI